MELKAEQIKAVLDHPEKALDLTDEQLGTALHALVGLYGASQQPAMVEKLMLLYRHYMTRIHPAQRMRNYQAIVDQVISGQTGVCALLPYLCCDADLTLVSTAVLDYAVMAPADDSEPTSAAIELLRLYEQGAIANGPALLGGLLMSGDRRILAQLTEPCRNLSCEEVEELIRCRSSILTAAVVEFYLDWLDELDSRVDADMYGTVAAGFANLALAAAEPVVYDIERVIPSAPDDAVRLLERWSLSDYARIIAPRLVGLARKEQGEPIMTEVMEAWGLQCP